MNRPELFPPDANFALSVFFFGLSSLTVPVATCFKSVSPPSNVASVDR